MKDVTIHHWSIRAPLQRPPPCSFTCQGLEWGWHRLSSCRGTASVRHEHTPTSEARTFTFILFQTKEIQTCKPQSNEKNEKLHGSRVTTNVFHQPLLAGIVGSTSPRHHFLLTNKPYQRTFWHYCIRSPMIFPSTNKDPHLLHTVLHLDSAMFPVNDKSIPVTRSYNKIREGPLGPPLKVILSCYETLLCWIWPFKGYINLTFTWNNKNGLTNNDNDICFRIFLKIKNM